MKNEKAINLLVSLIIVSALFAAGMGLFYRNPGQSYSYTSHRGEDVIINGQGLYYYDTVSMAAQQQGNDLIVLVVGLPLLILSCRLASRGFLRGKLLLTGTLGFFLYTYMSMAMLTSFNQLFLVYVALFGLSLYGFILSIMAINVQKLPEKFNSGFPRVWISVLFFAVGGFLILAWLGRIMPPLLKNQTPVLENTTTFVIQAMDLAIIVPLTIFAGVSLLRKNPWGYLLASVVTLKSVTLGLGVSAMAINMARRGVPENLFIMVPFLLITLLNLAFGVVLIRNIRE